VRVHGILFLDFGYVSPRYARTHPPSRPQSFKRARAGSLLATVRLMREMPDMWKI